MYFRLPTRIISLFTKVSIPLATLITDSLCFGIFNPLFLISFKIALAKGCDEVSSAAAASASIRLSFIFFPKVFSVWILGFPSVIVPVLSNITVSDFESSSR